jgi:hypothetical protein
MGPERVNTKEGQHIGRKLLLWAGKAAELPRRFGCLDRPAKLIAANRELGSLSVIPRQVRVNVGPEFSFCVV